MPVNDVGFQIPIGLSIGSRGQFVAAATLAAALLGGEGKAQEPKTTETDYGNTSS